MEVFLLMNKLGISLVLLCAFISCSPGSPEVVIYVSEDQVFSEPVLKDFERETGIRVRALYDTEEAKGTGVMNRLIAEKKNPRADVYWANEPIRAIVLKEKGVTARYFSPQAEGIPFRFRDREGHWTGFSARARVFIAGLEGTGPTSILDYAKAAWKGRAVMANPLFGTTTVWVASLFSVWGDEKAKDFLSQIRANSVKISSSNGESTLLVTNRECAFGLVDSDDAANAARSGKPVRMIVPDQAEGDLGCLVLPNAAVLVRNGPNRKNGESLIDYLLSPQTERQLAFANCAQVPLRDGVEAPPDVVALRAIKVMEVDYEMVARKLEEIQPFLRAWKGN
jgi:iron(III) transport system substrate-binding protein